MEKARKERRNGTVVARTGEVAHGTTKKFHLECNGDTVEGLLVGYGGDIFAYVNRCRHIPLSMDWMDNEFFTEDRRYLICANHGATYEPTTGECVWGPCFGTFLQAVPLEIRGEDVVVFCSAAEDES